MAKSILFKIIQNQLIKLVCIKIDQVNKYLDILGRFYIDNPDAYDKSQFDEVIDCLNELETLKNAIELSKD